GKISSRLQNSIGSFLLRFFVSLFLRALRPSIGPPPQAVKREPGAREQAPEGRGGRRAGRRRATSGGGRRPPGRISTLPGRRAPARRSPGRGAPPSPGGRGGN